MHGDVHKYPIVLLQIKYKGKMHSVKAIVSTCLTNYNYMLYLGTVFPRFNNCMFMTFSSM